MDIKLTPNEKELLMSGHVSGRIDIPPASAVELDDCVINLLRLQKKGLVIREDKSSYYGSFLLTGLGKNFCASQHSQAAGLVKSSVST